MAHRILYTKPVKALTEEEYVACYKTNMGARGSMRSTLARHRERGDRNARAVMCWSPESELLGWALIFPSRDGAGLHLYVRPRARRKGIATAILAHARRGRRNLLYAYPWDERSTAFYTPLIQKALVRDAYRS